MSKRQVWERRVPWDGPFPHPGEAIETRSKDVVWHIRVVTPLRYNPADGARLLLQFARVRTSELPRGAVVHSAVRMARSDPAGPARVRQLASEGATALEHMKWRDPDDNRPNASRRPRQISGYRQFCPLRRMAGLPNSRITDLHIAAADRLRAAYDLARIGPSTPPESIVARTAPAPRTGPSANAREQAAALVEVQRVFARVPAPLHAVTRAVVLHNRSLQGWCIDEAGRLGFVKQLDAKVELGRLLSVLDLLTAFYELDAAAGEDALV